MAGKERESKNEEIERKFLVNFLPNNLEQYSFNELKQGYVIIGDNGNLRIREERAEDTSIYYQTIKRGKGIVKTEIEMPITHEQFSSLWEGTDGRVVEKRRYRIPLNNNLTAELDVYSGQLSGLLTVEVEFTSSDNAKAFIPPDWFGKDVSDDKRYTNSTLATEGLPVNNNT